MMPLQLKMPAWQSLRAALSRDPRRTSLLVGLILVMIVLWARVVLKGPASATASLLRRSPAVLADPGSPASRLASSNPVLDWLGQPRRVVQRNLFSINLDYYARAGDRALAPDADPGTTQPASDEETDPARQKQILLENLHNQAAKLKLQTTLMGDTPRAMVNGQLLQVGDAIEGFTVVKIEARTIAVKQDGVVLEIEMP